jgi:hypothetical protein
VLAIDDSLSEIFGSASKDLSKTFQITFQGASWRSLHGSLLRLDINQRIKVKIKHQMSSLTHMKERNPQWKGESDSNS